MLSNANSQLLPGDVKPNSAKPRKSSDGLAGTYFAGVTAKGANTFEHWGLDVGIQAGGFLSDHFALGAGFYYLLTQNVQILPNEPYFLQLTYGGLEPQFFFKFGNFAFHAKLMIGFGFAGYSQSTNFDVLSDLDGDWIYVSEPSLGLSVIPTEDFWISVDAGYRQTGGVDFKMIKQQDLNGPVISITFKTVLN
jgi:hypothetical protein